MPSQYNTGSTETLFRDANGLFNLVHRFNAHPATYAHASWLEPLIPVELFNAVKKTRRGVSRLSKILLQRHRLSNHACYDFDNRWWRFALLPAEVIMELALYCGMAFQHRQIAAAVSKPAIDNVKSSIGAHVYLFTVQRASLMVGNRPGLDLYWDGCSDISLFARQYGAAYFLSHFRKAPHAIAGRLAFKFSRPLAGMAVNSPSDETGWQLFKRILLHEIDPRWQTLFT